MTVFKTFLKILNRNKFIVLMYTIILLLFSGFHTTTNDNNISFVGSKPDLVIVNEDENVGITKDLISYLEKKNNVKNIEITEEDLNDALFYRDVNYIVYIPKNFRNDFLSHKNPEIKIKSTKDYQASLADMILNRYVKIANIYLETIGEEEKIIENIHNTLDSEVEISLTSKLDVSSLSKTTSYFNFASYSVLAGCVYVICLILSSFKNESIKKRTLISSMNYKKQNRILLLSNGLFAFVLWLFYILISFILCKESMFTNQGILYIINSFIFSLVALTIAFLIANIVQNKNAINGIVNVVALGSSFLCGAFVPMEWLPNSVIQIAHVLPSYYYIKTNELIKEIEIFDFNHLKPMLENMMILVFFMMLFIIITSLISKKKREV